MRDLIILPHTKRKGDITELVVAAGLMKKGLVVCKPFGENQRYDLVFEYSGEFFTVQCKTGRVSKGCVEFNTVSFNPWNGTKTYEQIDFFGVHCFETNGTYLLPNLGLPKGKCSLRIVPVKKKQKPEPRRAEDYLLDNADVAQLVERAPRKAEAGGSIPSVSTIRLRP
jgi:hypothetical protein